MTDKDQDGWMIETNQWGGIRRYRMVGGIKEYEPTTNGIPVSELQDYNRRQREQKERFYAENQKRMAERTAIKFCPVRMGQNDETACLGEACALHYDGTCIFARRQVTEVRETVGKRCPFSIFNGKCTERCALNKNGGCTFLQT